MRLALTVFVRLLGALLLLVLLAAGSVWVLLHGSLARLDGQIALTGLQAPAQIERDALGSVTVTAQSRLDASRALGYAHAQERYFEMDLLRRSAAGELAELFGPLALDADRKARVHRMRERMQQTYAALPPADRAQLDAYRDGVNAGLAALQVRPYEYLLTRNRPQPWRSEDSLLAIAAMFFTLTSDVGPRDLALARLHAVLPADAYAFFTGEGGPLDAPLRGTVMNWPALPAFSALDLHARLAGAASEAGTTFAHAEPADGTAETPREQQVGSNSLAVAGRLTGGAAMVANDMHLNLGVPNLWFRARLRYTAADGSAVDTSGVSLPGAPAIVAGSNSHVAWGFTNSYIDTSDWVRITLDPADPTRYRTADGWQTIQERPQILKVHGGADVNLPLRETVYGPILAQDADGTPLAQAWVAQQPGAVNLQLMQLDTARSAAEAVEIAHQAGVPPQNFVVADQAGHIAWTLAGRIPHRIGIADGNLPADWSPPATGWDGWLDPAQVPVLMDPPGARLWTANQRILDGSELQVLGDGGYDLGVRAARIRDDLAARSHFTAADLLAIELDDRASLLDRWEDLLDTTVAHLPDEAQRRRAQAALADWNGNADANSVSYLFVREFRRSVSKSLMSGLEALVQQRFADFRLPALPQDEQAIWRLIEARPYSLLPPGTAGWDAFLREAAQRSMQKLDTQPGGFGVQTWGEYNHVRIRPTLAPALPAFLGRWLDMPGAPQAGDTNMPRVAGPDFGASERLGVAPGDEAHGYLMMPGGQSDNPLSPFYGAGHHDWLTGTPTPFLPGPPQHELRLVPAGNLQAR